MVRVSASVRVKVMVIVMVRVKGRLRVRVRLRDTSRDPLRRARLLAACLRAPCAACAALTAAGWL